MGMDGFKTPPLDDFHSYSGQVRAEGDNLGTLNHYAAGPCADNQGLEGLLALVSGIIPEVAQFFEEKIGQCRRGMGLVAQKADATANDYRSTDHDTAAQLRALYPTPLGGFPDLGSLPGASRLGSFDSDKVQPKEPDDASQYEAKSISHMVWTLHTNMGEGFLAGAEKLFKFCTGQSLIELLLTPLMGDFGRLEYLHDAYKTLSDGLFDVTGDLREGSWKLGSEWTGDAARGFDSYMFCWTMGMGGVGDAAAEVAKIYHDAYDAILVLVRLALRDIGTLINDDIEQLAKLAAQTAEADTAIEVAGGGPEDPFADAGALLVTGVEMYRMYKIVSRIVTAINAIEGTYKAIQTALHNIPDAIHAVIAAVNAPLPSIGSLIDDVEQRGFQFERNAGWSHTLGAARIGLLPAA